MHDAAIFTTFDIEGTNCFVTIMSFKEFNLEIFSTGY